MTNRAQQACTVLIADDEPCNRALLASVLEPEGYDLITATNGLEARQKASECAPDVVLLDVVMPGLDGIEVCRQLKQNSATAQIPVLLISMLSDRQDRLKGIEAGADDFLTKPVDPDEIKLRVRNYAKAKGLYEKLEANYRKLEELEKTRDNLTHMIVHDMRAPLSAMFGFLDLLKESEESQERETGRAYIEHIHHNASVLLELVNTVLDVRRFEAGHMPVYRTRCDLVRLAREASEQVYSLVRQRRINFQLLATATPSVWCDESLIRRVVVNLLTNAIKYTPEEGDIQLSVAADNGQAIVTVRDAGPGIPRQYHERIFEKFFQVRSQDHKVGTGLGLAFCRLAVLAHQGSIGVESEEGQGSSFWFTLAVKPAKKALPIQGLASAFQMARPVVPALR